MSKPSININLRARLAALRPQNPLQKHTRFKLPDNNTVSDQNKSLRQSLSDRMRQKNGNGQARTYSQNELLAKLGDLDQVADPIEHLRSFHEQEIMRVIDLFQAQHNTLLISEQVSELRTAIVRWTFQLALKEHQANLALLVGGSAVYGAHTFLTDLDFVVLPHEAEDREAAGRVQSMMAGILVSMGIDADFVMPNHFNYETFQQLESRYLPHTKSNDNTFEAIMQRSSASFFRFLMDVQVVETSVEGNDFSERLKGLQDRLIYNTPDHVLENLVRSFNGIEVRSSQPDNRYLYDIKNNPLRLFHYALYASRAALGIRESNFVQVIDQLQERGNLSVPEANQALQALRLFIGLRHLMGLSLSDTMDSTKITPEALSAIARDLGETEADLRTVIEQQQSNLVNIARTLFERIGHSV